MENRVKLSNLIAKLISQLNGSVFVLMIILIIAFIAVFRIGKWSEKFSHHEEKIKKTEEIAKNVSESIIELKTKVNLIYENTNPRRTVASNSPISLTDIGKEIARNIEANRILEENKSKLINEVEFAHPQNAYDIQMSSMQIAKEKMVALLKEDDLIKIKEEAYKNGILIEDVMSIFGVLLRNEILQRRGIPISDVDRHQPDQSTS